MYNNSQETMHYNHFQQNEYNMHQILGNNTSNKRAAEATADASKRLRGRPPGSKNKPRPPVVIMRASESSPALQPHLLEIPDGNDVVSSLIRFSRRKGMALSVLSSSGAVLNVMIRQAEGETVAFRGRFEILSMSATFMTRDIDQGVSPVLGGGVSVTLLGHQGCVFGGTVAGPMVASGTVAVVAAVFAKPTFERLPVAEVDDLCLSVDDDGGVEDHE